MSLDEVNELNTLKNTIKKWEHEFFTLNSKKPSKEDIHQHAPVEIKDAYRSYWKLKNKASSEDVWSQNLNKSYHKADAEKKVKSVMKTFCDKIKKRSSLKIEDHNLKNQSSSDKNKGINASKEEKKSMSSSLSDVKCFEENTNTENPGSVTPSTVDIKFNSPMKNDFAFELPVKITPTNCSASFSNKIRIKNINVIPLTFDSNKSTKTLHFKKDIDENWLKRCDESISKDLENLEALKDVSKVDKFKDLKQSSPEEVIDSFSQPSSETKRTRDFSENDTTHSPLKVVDVDLNNSKPQTDENDAVTSPPSVLINKINSSNEHSEYAEAPEDKAEITNDNCNNDLRSRKRKLSLETTEVTDVKTARKVSNLKRKIAAGTLNENYLKVNIKKKKFSRGHHAVNVRKMKWTKWKKMKKESSGTASNITGCFKCGELGHWARQCRSVMGQKADTQDPFEEDNFDEAPLPTLEEAAKLAKENKPKPFKKFNLPSNEANQKHTDQSEELNSGSEMVDADMKDPPRDLIKPLYDTSDGIAIKTPKAVFNALKEMGYKNFREGQETAVMRVLCGLSTLVVLPTGSGKSLCYQLPAFMYAKHTKSIAVVVSPLVSLMEDQVTGLPSCLHAVCLHSGMSDVQKKKAMQEISEGLAHILLVSPEAIIGSQLFSRTVLETSMPPISFVCIDEVHCISQWSHNFRPSYLQLYKVLTHKMGIKCILGLTATATLSTIKDIIQHLDLKCHDESVIGSTNVPSNLHISISKDKDRDKALLQLLSGDRFKLCSSVIIYCIRRVETERLAALLRTCLQGEEIPDNDPKRSKKKTKNKKNYAWTVEAYHAGLTPQSRRSIQKKFMSGKLRVVIATVAFGMGLDKADVRAIIHYNMPKAFESYVQEIGRAGRDGLDSHCHLFLDSEGKDLWEQQKHIYANSLDRYTLRKLLRRVFQPCKCPIPEKSSSCEDASITNNPSCPKHEIAFSINDTVQELDVKEENISTLLCYLELHSKKWIEILPPTYSTCAIRCYGGSKQMHSIATKNPVVATALALNSEKGQKWDKGSSLTFSVVQVASAMGWESSTAKRSLKSLEWNDFKRKTGVMVEFSDLAFHVKAPGNLSVEELDEVLDFLHDKVVKTEETELRTLKLLFSVFQKFSFPHYWDCCDDVNEERSEGIKQAINKYFCQSDLLYKEFEDCFGPENKNEMDLSYVKSLIRELICTHRDQTFSGRSIARIFHGIGSPCFPAEIWGTIRKFWRCSMSMNFNSILKMANEELRTLK